MAGTSSFTVQVKTRGDNRTYKRCRSRSAQLPPPPNPPNITTTSFLPGTVGEPYSQPVQVTGGTGALTWTISAGTLPANLNLNQINGVISGTPTAAGTSSFTVRVQDAGGLADTQALSITINQPAPPPSPSITTTSLPAGTIGQPYSQTLRATGGTGGLTWSLVPGTGTLPQGLNLDQTTGVISGTPTWQPQRRLPSEWQTHPDKTTRKRSPSSSISPTRRLSRPPRSQEGPSGKPTIRRYKRRVVSGHSPGVSLARYQRCFPLVRRCDFRHSHYCRNREFNSTGRRHIDPG